MNKGGRRKDPIWESFYKLSVNKKAVPKGKNCRNIQSNKATRIRVHFSSCVKNVRNNCVDVEASSSCERQAEADLKQNKRCLDKQFYEEDDKPHSLHKKAISLQGNIKSVF